MHTWKSNTIIKGNHIDGSTVIFRKKDGTLEKGLEFPDDSRIWFEDYIVNDFHDGLAKITKEWKYGYIDRCGKQVIPIRYEIADDFSEGIAVTSDLQNTFITNKKGQDIFFYDEVLFNTPFNLRISKVAKLDDSGNYRSEALINSKGQFITSFEFTSRIKHLDDLLDEDDVVSEGMVRISDKDYYGFLDLDGNMVIPPMYDRVSKFKSGIAAVALDDWAGFINHDNDFIIDPVFEDAAFAYENLLFVKKDDYWGIITRSGEKVTNFIFDQFAQINDGMLPAMCNGKWGLLSLDTDFKTEFRFTFPPFFHEGIIHFIEGRMHGICDLFGNELISYLPQSKSSFIYN